MKVLIVEDSPIAAKGIMLTLEDMGHEATEAGTLREAVEVLKQICPAVILLDLNLPNGKGVFTIKEIRKYCTCPIVVLSGADKEIVPQAIEAGAFAFLYKGELKLEDLNKVLQQALHVQEAFKPVERSIEKKDDLLRESIEDSKNIVPPKKAD